MPFARRQFFCVIAAFDESTSVLSSGDTYDHSEFLHHLLGHVNRFARDQPVISEYMSTHRTNVCLSSLSKQVHCTTRVVQPPALNECVVSTIVGSQSCSCIVPKVTSQHAYSYLCSRIESRYSESPVRTHPLLSFVPSPRSLDLTTFLAPSSNQVYMTISGTTFILEANSKTLSPSPCHLYTNHEPGCSRSTSVSHHSLHSSSPDAWPFNAFC